MTMKQPLRIAFGLMAGLMLAGQAAAPSGIRTEAPEPWTPQGDLHFLALQYGETGWFADSGSVSRDGDAAEARVLVVESEMRRIFEGRIRHSWHVVSVDCGTREWVTTAQDAYGPDGAWLAGYTVPVSSPRAPAVDHEQRMIAYLCEGERPADFRAEPTTAAAIASVLEAVR